MYHLRHPHGDTPMEWTIPICSVHQPHDIRLIRLQCSIINSSRNVFSAPDSRSTHCSSLVHLLVGVATLSPGELSTWWPLFTSVLFMFHVSLYWSNQYIKMYAESQRLTLPGFFDTTNWIMCSRGSTLGPVGVCSLKLLWKTTHANHVVL